MHQNQDHTRKENDALWPHLDRFIRHVLNTDLSVMVLKGHLVVEQAMDELLASILTVSELPNDSKLEFDQKLSLVRAFVCSRNFALNSDILNSVKQLNKLRNEVGHILIESSDLNLRVDSLIMEHYKRIGKKCKPKDKGSGGFLIVIKDIIFFLVKSKVALDAERSK